MHQILLNLLIVWFILEPDRRYCKSKNVVYKPAYLIIGSPRTNFKDEYVFSIPKQARLQIKNFLWILINLLIYWFISEPVFQPILKWKYTNFHKNPVTFAKWNQSVLKPIHPCWFSRSYVFCTPKNIKFTLLSLNFCFLRQYRDYFSFWWIFFSR